MVIREREIDLMLCLSGSIEATDLLMDLLGVLVLGAVVVVGVEEGVGLSSGSGSSGGRRHVDGGEGRGRAQVSRWRERSGGGEERRRYMMTE